MEPGAFLLKTLPPLLAQRPAVGKPFSGKREFFIVPVPLFLFADALGTASPIRALANPVVQICSRKGNNQREEQENALANIAAGLLPLLGCMKQVGVAEHGMAHSRQEVGADKQKAADGKEAARPQAGQHRT